MTIQISDQSVEERVIPATIQRPSFRIIIDTPLNAGDTIIVTTTINDNPVSTPITYTIDQAPADGNSIVGVLMLGFAEQPTAPLPTAAVQVVNRTDVVYVADPINPGPIKKVT